MQNFYLIHDIIMFRKHHQESVERMKTDMVIILLLKITTQVFGEKFNKEINVNIYF